MDFYYLRKVNMTIEVEEKDRKMRGFATYKLELRNRGQAM